MGSYKGFASHDEYNQYEKEMALIERDERAERCGNIETTKQDDTSIPILDGKTGSLLLTGQKHRWLEQDQGSALTAKEQVYSSLVQPLRPVQPVKVKEN